MTSPSPLERLAGPGNVLAKEPPDAEPGSDEVQGFARDASTVTTSQVAYAEARSTLARRRRERALSPRGFAAAKRAVEADWAYIPHISPVF
jgi:hypothetical protein